ncbi:hydantoinase/oxoprolinase family protein [Burkholderia cepacia]|uniref:hydantoinase/oxoprolinase family protein n=1 Tax=Burkholderia cepacia TaxID=292 RepID=UPI002AB7B3CD|nr:hydantoinase/oxoprolinase family protein [Burkholderia cepacia]
MSATSIPGYRLGIDIGGTFTDFVLMNEQTGRTISFKTPSVPSDPARAVLTGVRRLIEEEKIDPALIRYFVHGTTLGLNTLIERRGARTGMLVTRGFRDLLEIGRLRLPDPTNYYVEKTRPVVDRQLVRELDERILATGAIHKALDLTVLLATVQELVDEGIESLALCFMHSYRNSEHEAAAVKAIRAAHPTLYVCASSEIWPQQREYERALVTVINAYVGSQMKRYFDRLARNMSEVGVSAPLLTTKSNGGVMTARSASEVPVETLLSGPASGVMGALQVGRVSGNRKLIAWDMGGTSVDVAIIDDGVLYSTDSQIGDFPIIVPAVDVSSIGAGGGSIAWVDDFGMLKVGPKSAGADPGPACYGRGGKQPTVTDAYVAVGILDPSRFNGGRGQLDSSLALKALETVGAPLNLSPLEAAAAILDVTTANMYAQFMPLMARKGVEPRDFSLIAYGGAGPTHAFLLAREVGIRRVVVPRSPGTLCALGSLVTDLRRDFIQTVTNLEQVEHSSFASLDANAMAWLAEQDTAVEERTLLRSADMRYRGQSFDLTVRMPDADDGVLLVDAFHDQYARIYGFSDRSAEVEFTNLRVTALGVVPKPSTQVSAQAAEAGNVQQRRTLEPVTQRDVQIGKSAMKAAVFWRPHLAAGDTFRGAVVVEALDTTIFIPEGFEFHIDAWDNLIAEAV